MTVDFRDRQYVSQYSTDVLGLAVHKAGAPGDVDNNEIEVTLLREETNLPVFQRFATRVGVGLYEVSLSSEESSVPGNYTVIWSYAIDTVAQEPRTFIYIGESAPSYDQLAPAMKDIVDHVWIRFADLFDSPDGGPNLMTYFQSNFQRGRMAQLLRVAVGLLNTTAQPHMTYTIDGDGGASFPVDQWGSLLESALYVEAVRHLCRSYVEQPNLVGPQVTRLDRRDYLDRWQSILRYEDETLQRQLEVFKISHMGFGRPRVLVSGGVFGRFGPTRVAGSMAARPRYWTRAY